MDFSLNNILCNTEVEKLEIERIDTLKTSYNTDSIVVYYIPALKLFTRDISVLKLTCAKWSGVNDFDTFPGLNEGYNKK